MFFVVVISPFFLKIKNVEIFSFNGGPLSGVERDRRFVNFRVATTHVKV